METITLCPESVAAYKELMTEPKKHGIDIPALSECFSPADEGTVMQPTGLTLTPKVPRT